MTDAENITVRDQIGALYTVAQFRPVLTICGIGLSVFSAALAGIGLGFIVPVLEIAQGNVEPAQLSDAGRTFFDVYEFFGIPFSLEYIIAGVAVVMSVRFISAFIVAWIRAMLQIGYIRHLQTLGFDQALDARVSYYDTHGSDEIMNAIVTQAEYAGMVIDDAVKLFEQIALSVVYLLLALLIAPVLTLVTAVVLGGVVVGLRWSMESGYAVGDRVAEANERIQQNVQTGTQGIRDIKLFGVADDVFGRFQQAVDLFYSAEVKRRRNAAAMNNFYRLAIAVAIFVLIYAAIRYLSMSISTLGVFLFAMFRLSPRISTLNNLTYRVAGNLPHVIRTQELIDGLTAQTESDVTDRSPPNRVREIAFEDVTFRYTDEETVLDSISFVAEQGEFVAFVGPSGAGKSTIVSLLTRLYEPDDGAVTANGVDIATYGLDGWRDRVSMVRQQPYLFNDTLRYNITVGAQNSTEDEIREACEVAQVTEFLDDLPAGLDTELGDNGVRLSGGQRQRVAIARALLKDADVLVMDEATSDLDTSLEKNIQQNLETAENGRILVVIAHRLSTVVNADRIYAMEDGRISEAGHHRELVKQGGTYERLYSSQ